jgi:hypothetical protein
VKLLSASWSSLTSLAFEVREKLNHLSHVIQQAGIRLFRDSARPNYHNISLPGSTRYTHTVAWLYLHSRAAFYQKSLASLYLGVALASELLPILLHYSLARREDNSRCWVIAVIYRSHWNQRKTPTDICGEIPKKQTNNQKHFVCIIFFSYFTAHSGLMKRSILKALGCFIKIYISELNALS